MMTLARPPDEWDPETTTAAALRTLRPVAIPGGMVFAADWTRLEPWYGSKDCCFAPDLQEALANFRGSWLGNVRSQHWESEMSDERPLSEHTEANTVLHKAEALMRGWTAGPSPFVGMFPQKQLDRVWPLLCEKIDRVLNELWYEFDYSEKDLDRQRHFFLMMLRMIREGARDGDVDPVAAGAPRVSVIAPNLSESPIERALLAALRRSGRLCPDPANIRSDCERVPLRCGIFIYQQAPVLKYRTDFLLGAMASPDADPHWVVVECDGHEFHERTAEQAEHDRARDRAMTAAGYRVFRFTGREIRRDVQKCADEVMAYLHPFGRPQS